MFSSRSSDEMVIPIPLSVMEEIMTTSGEAASYRSGR